MRQPRAAGEISGLAGRRTRTRMQYAAQVPTHIPAEPPRLDRPGAGISWLQRLVARYHHLPRYFRKTPPEAAIEKWRRHGEKILEDIEGLDADGLATRVLVTPLPALEDSSRWWSIAMVLEHLMVVGRRIADATVVTSKGVIPDIDNDPASVKPRGDDEPSEVVAAFRSFLDEYPSTLQTATWPLRDDVRFPHPWFGPRTPHEWLCISALHQSVHRAQIRQIVAQLKARR
jgi:hypothetical protein